MQETTIAERAPHSHPSRPFPDTPAIGPVDLSIIVPTYHRETQLVGAIESVLGDVGLAIEVLVSDDSPDGSAEPYVRKIDDKRVQYVKREKPTGGNPALVRNERARAARGRYFYFLDDDDTASPSTLKTIVDRLDRTGHGVAVGIVRPFGREGSRVVAEERAHYRQAEQTLARMQTRYGFASCILFRSSIICCSACVVRREAFFELGGFETTYPLYEDVAMYLRAVRHFGFDFVPEVLLNRRTGEPSLIQNERDAERTHVSYRMMHDKYRQEFGLVEYAALKALSFTLPKSTQG
jgi:glycosyltransferase involved in cell wall biosynthesis